MYNRFALNIAKLKLYLTENEGWEQTLRFQETEIPEMLKLLSGVEATGETREKVHFDKELTTQQNEMKQLTDDLEIQQQRLTKNCETNSGIDIETFLLQDILRDRIKAVEKIYIDLKCSFMNYLATVA